MIHFLIICVILAVMLTVGSFILSIMLGIFAGLAGLIAYGASAVVNVFKRSR